MKIIDLEQGSDSWKEWRKKRITATDAGIILGVNPWTSPLELYWQKYEMTPSIKVNAAMKRGSELEPIARQSFIDQYHIEMTPCVVESDEYFWCSASLDGISKCGRYILEIKCPNLDTHKLAIQGSIKPYYISQVQHQLFVTRAEKAYYWSYHPDHIHKFAIIGVYPDADYIDKMIDLERSFYEYNMCKMVEPPADWKFKKKLDNT